MLLSELFKESFQCFPSSILLFFRLLDNFVRKNNMEDKRAKRDLQVNDFEEKLNFLKDVAQKIIESCVLIAGKSFSSVSSLSR